MKKLLKEELNNKLFWCLGCNKPHGIVTGNNGWAWNGSLTNPTFSPSILVKYYKPTVEGEAMMARRDKIPVGTKYPGTDEICHSYVTDGKIQFLSDCTHTLANQIIDLPMHDWDA
jgi:hypothetical protein